MVKLVGSMHGNEVSGCQLLAFLADYLVLGYAGQTDNRVKSLVEKTEIYILPLINPDGYSISKVYAYSPSKILSPFLSKAPLQYVPKIPFPRATIDRLTRNKTKNALHNETWW